MATKTGNKIRHKGIYRLYRNGIPVSETPYNLLDAFGSVPAITIEELELMTTQDIEARAATMIEAIVGKCSDFKIINNVIEKSDDCSDEEDDYMIGQIIDYGGIHGTWDAEKWMDCDGSTLNVDDYPELYGVIGREWTLDSVPQDKFTIPNLKGRGTIGFDESSPASPRDTTIYNHVELNYGRIGNTGGKASVYLNSGDMVPRHSHDLKIHNVDAEHSDSGHDYYPAQFIQSTAPVGTDKSWTGQTEYAGGNDDGSVKAHENRSPYAVVYKLIRYK
jgi:microcystin-dependent protein